MLLFLAELGTELGFFEWYGTVLKGSTPSSDFIGVKYTRVPSPLVRFGRSLSGGTTNRQAALYTGRFCFNGC